MFAMIHGFSILATIVSLAMSVQLFFAKNASLRADGALLLFFLLFALLFITSHSIYGWMRTALC